MDREAWRWIGVFAATFVLSIFGGWFLPDGLNDIAHAFGQQKVPVTTLTRFFSFALLFLILAGIDLMLWFRTQSRKVVEDVDATVRDSLDRHCIDIAERALVRGLLPTGAATPDEAAEAAGLIKSFGQLLVSVPPRLLSGYSVLIRKGMAQVGADLNAVANRGLSVDIEQHVQITRKLATATGKFLQIQRRAYPMPEGSTQEWLNLVEELGRQLAAPEYILLMRAEELETSAETIQTMFTHLSAYGWSFKCCELELVEDSLGENLPTENLDVYGDVGVKFHPPPERGYRGRPRFDLRLTDLAGETELQRFIATVRAFAKTPTAEWPGRVQQQPSPGRIPKRRR